MTRSLGSRVSSMLLGRPESSGFHHSARAPQLRGIHSAAHPSVLRRRNFPSQAWAPFHSFTGLTPRGPRSCRSTHLHHAPSEVSAPSVFCQPRRATFTRQAPSSPVTLRPQGFAPSRRFAPPAACRACSIPVPLLGFPFEALVPPRCRTPSRTPFPSGFWPTPNEPASPSGIVHTTKSPPTGLGFSQAFRVGASLGFVLRGFLFPRSAHRMTGVRPLSPFSELAAC